MLTEAICYVCEADTSFEDFAETARSFMESIAGLETLTEPEASSLVNQLWSVFMAKKPSKSKQAEKSTKKGKKDAVQEASEASSPKQSEEAKSASKQAEAAEPKKLDLDKPAVKKAIETGQAVLKDGKSKADAAWAIYGSLKDEDKDLIVAAFIKGATLTEKGALTYWYNCKRRAAKEAPAK